MVNKDIFIHAIKLDPEIYFMSRIPIISFEEAYKINPKIKEHAKKEIKNELKSYSLTIKDLEEG